MCGWNGIVVLEEQSGIIILLSRQEFLERGLGVFRLLLSARLFHFLPPLASTFFGGFSTLNGSGLLKFLSYSIAVCKQKWSFITKQYFFSLCLR